MGRQVPCRGNQYVGSGPRIAYVKLAERRFYGLDGVEVPVLAQQQDVFDAVQRMRQKAQGTGALASNQQQTVQTGGSDNTNTAITSGLSEGDKVLIGQVPGAAVGASVTIVSP